MRSLVTRLGKDGLLRANALMVGGTMIANVGSYLFHLVVGRLLIADEYGKLQSLISLSNIFNVPLLTLNAVMVRYIASLLGKGETDQIAYVYRRVSGLLWRFFLVGGVVFLLLTGPILRFLHLTDPTSVVLLDIALFFGFIQVFNRSVLQGLAHFAQFVIAHIMESWSRFAIGAAAAVVGWQSTGAFGAFVAAGALTYLYTVSVLKKVLPHKLQAAPLPKRALAKDSIHSFVMNISMMSLFNADVVLVRHFLPGEASGLYAALSVLGKIIYFGTAPVANTLLPLASRAGSHTKDQARTFLISLLLIAGMSAGVVILYALIPELALSVLIGKQYLAASPYLAMFGTFLALCAMINLTSYYFFSVGRMVPLYFMPIAALAQVVGIWFYHDTLASVVTVSLAVSASLFGVLLLYYAYARAAQIPLHNRPGIPPGKND